MVLNVHLSKFHVVHGLDTNICLTDRLENTTEAAQKNKDPRVCLHQKNAYRLLCSFISITFVMPPAPLIIHTQKDFPSCFAMAFLFCKTQLTETLKGHLLAENWLAKISTDFFFHQSVSAVRSGSDPPTSLTKARVLLLFLLLSLSGHKVVETWVSTLLPVLHLEVWYVGFSQSIIHSHMKD